MGIINYTCKSTDCHFDTTPTIEILVFNAVVFLGAILAIYLLSKVYKHYVARFALILLAVFVFEFFTHNMWTNYHMGKFAYVYRDVSWVLTLGWASLISLALYLGEKYFTNYPEWRKFILVLTFSTVLGLLGESAVVNLGIRGYSPEVLQIIGNMYIPGFNIPLAAFYYIPVFMALTISFYKFWAVFLGQKVVVPHADILLLKKFAISLVGVLLFEIMMDPLLINANLPEWSYVYRDVSLLMSGVWLMIIWASIGIIDLLFRYAKMNIKFFGYIILATLIAVPLESLAVAKGIRIYSDSALASFSGFKVPLLNVPVELAFGLPFCLALMIAFTLYWTYYSKSKSTK